MKMVKNHKRQSLIRKILIFSVIFAFICHPLLALAQIDWDQKTQKYHKDTVDYCLRAEDALMSDREVRDLLGADSPEQLLRDKLEVKLIWRKTWTVIDRKEVAVDYAALSPEENEAGYPVTISHQHSTGKSIEQQVIVYVYAEEDPEPSTEPVTEPPTETETQTETQSETAQRPDPKPEPPTEPPTEPTTEPVIDGNWENPDKLQPGGDIVVIEETETEPPAEPKEPVKAVPPQAAPKPADKQTEKKETESSTEKPREKTKPEKKEEVQAVAQQAGSGDNNAQEPQSESSAAEEEGPAKQSTLKFLGEHAYVATFGGAGVAAACFGVSVVYDIQTLLWYEKKKLAILRKRRMIRKRG